MLNEKSNLLSMSSMEQLAIIKKSYPGFNVSEVDDHYLLSIMRNLTTDPQKSKQFLLQKKFSETPEDCQAALEAFRLPEGWGNSLRYFTDQVIDGISEGMSVTEITNIAIVGDTTFLVLPNLTLLLQIIRIYAFFLEGGTGLGSMITREGARRIAAENEHLGALMSNAQELLDLLKFCDKLRYGGTRLQKRIIDCVDQLLNIEW